MELNPHEKDKHSYEINAQENKGCDSCGWWTYPILRTTSVFEITFLWGIAELVQITLKSKSQNSVKFSEIIHKR